MRAFVVLVLCAVTVGPARANEASRATSREALGMCEEVDPDAEHKTAAIDRLDRAIALAESAIAADERDTLAHLALFCALGRQLQVAGLSWRSFARLQRAHQEIDRASELAPDEPDVLVARGEFLCQIPRPLGGNQALGEELLARALELKPDHVAGRLYFAKAIAARHAPDARAQAYEALAAAKKAGAVREQAEAQELLASLDN